MTQGGKLRAAILFLMLSSAILFVVACRQNPQPAVAEELPAPPGEPDTYTATIVHSSEDGERRESSETRVARSGNLRRQEWTENGERLALITRFDSGKSFLLNLNRQIYTETDFALQSLEKPKNKSLADPAKTAEAGQSGPEAIDRASALDFADDNFAEIPASLERRVLANAYIADQLCKVTQERAGYADGRTEVTTLYRAENLLGLVVKTERESVSSSHRVKLVSEWRDIRLAASADDFEVPAGFKKVQSLAARQP